MIEPDLQFSILCDQVRREDNGKWILLGVFENISVAHFPSQHGALCVLNKWIRGEGSWTQKTRFVDENDRVLLERHDIAFNLAELPSNFLAIQAFAGLPLEGAGNIWIEVYLNDELKQRYPISVSLLGS